MFNSAKFDSTQWEARTEAVPLPDLAPWFDGEPAWVVRGLTAGELARVNEAAEAAKNLEAAVSAIAGGAPADKAAAIRSLLGLADGDVPQDLARRLEMLRIAAVDPVCDRSRAHTMSKAFPVEFYALTNVITRLTGQGMRPGGLTGSGETPPSEPPSV